MPLSEDKLKKASAVIRVPKYDPHELLSIKDLEHLFGVSRQTVCRMISQKLLHGIKVGGRGGRWRFPRAEIERYIQQQKRISRDTEKERARVLREYHAEHGEDE